MNEERTKIPGQTLQGCPRCKKARQSYYGYPTICDGHNCYEQGKERGYKSK